MDPGIPSIGDLLTFDKLYFDLQKKKIERNVVGLLVNIITDGVFENDPLLIVSFRELNGEIRTFLKSKFLANNNNSIINLTLPDGAQTAFDFLSATKQLPKRFNTTDKSNKFGFIQPWVYSFYDYVFETILKNVDNQSPEKMYIVDNLSSFIDDMTMISSETDFISTEKFKPGYNSTIKWFDNTASINKNTHTDGQTDRSTWV